eukprot:5201359-Pleurochrysis_carterae.AAC.1
MQKLRYVTLQEYPPCNAGCLEGDAALSREEAILDATGIGQERTHLQISVANICPYIVDDKAIVPCAWL